MKSASGLLYRNGGFIEAHVVLKNGTPVIGEGLLENAEITGIILPMPINCHTHLGDAFIKRPERATVEELVAPPDGLKHRMLAAVDPEEQITAMMGAIDSMASTGISHYIDFREGGLEGARRLLLASRASGINPVIFGRPLEGYVPEEMDALLKVVDGIGMSAVSDMEFQELDAISDHAKKAGKGFAIHASETVRENPDEYLELKPNLLVHMVKADSDDLIACSAAGIPIVVCPRANAFFGLKPDIKKMLDANITVCLGTDNAMLASPDMFAEMKSLAGDFGLAKEDVFSIVFENGRKVLNSLPGLWMASSQDYLVLESSLNDPWGSVIEAKPGNICLFDTEHVSSEWRE